MNPIPLIKQKRINFLDWVADNKSVTLEQIIEGNFFPNLTTKQLVLKLGRYRIKGYIKKDGANYSISKQETNKALINDNFKGYF